MDSECTVCGVTFRPKKNKSNRFCSIACYRVAQRRHEYQNTRGDPKKCEYCGNEFRASYRKKRNGEKADHIFCSRSCYDKYRAERRVNICRYCGKEFINTQGHFYCNDSCWRKDQVSKQIRFCTVCGQGFIMRGHRAATCSDDCERILKMQNEETRREKISIAFTGPNHPQWVGGRQHYRGDTWRQARRAAIKRDEDTCQRCGITGKQNRKQFGKGLEVHHIKPFREFSDPGEANSLDNLITLCIKCHKVREWELWRERRAEG